VTFVTLSFLSFNMKHFLLFTLVLLSLSCKSEKKIDVVVIETATKNMKFAKGFSIEKLATGVTIISLNSPWPNAQKGLRYALVPKDKISSINLDRSLYDAIVLVPVKKLIVTSTTHIPVLETLGIEHTLVGFPDTKYISSEKTRKLIDTGKVQELGVNGQLNTEMVIALKPDLVVGFSMSSQNKAYETLQRANIPVVYNGDWIEETPLGKAEWIKFFAPFFGKEQAAKILFSEIEIAYTQAKALAQKATKKPTVMSGAIYKDVWYLPGGNSWVATFISDANANYIYSDTKETGSLSLSWESVLERGQHADFWISPSQFTNYDKMLENSLHYQQFDAFRNKKVYSFAGRTGATGGVLYYELAPNRPDLVLKDLIHIFHPEMTPNYTPFFFKPLK
jgi:iron complex transport system substrate-binding protein